MLGIWPPDGRLWPTRVAGGWPEDDLLKWSKKAHTKNESKPMESYLKYKGQPLSKLWRVLDVRSEIPLWTWSTPLKTRPNTAESLSALTAQGYRQSPKDVWILPALTSQLSEILIVEEPLTEDDRKILDAGPENGEAIRQWLNRRMPPQLWAKEDSIKHAIRYPVTLAFSMEIEGNASQRDMLQFLPPPNMGEHALVPEYGAKPNGKGKSLIYHIAQLPATAQERQKALGKALLQLAQPTSWVHHNLLHSLMHSYFSEEVDSHEFANYAFQIEEPIKISALEQAHHDLVALRQSWQRPDWLVQWQEICRMAQELASDYHSHHQSSENRPVPTIAHVFRGGIADIFTAQPVNVYSAAAISKKPTFEDGEIKTYGDWQQEEAEKENELILSYTRTKPSGTNIVQIREELKQNQSREATLLRMAEQANKLSDLDSDVYMAMIVQMLAGAKDEKGFTWITATKILDYRGIRPKKNSGDLETHYTGGHRWEDIEAVATCIRSMENMFIRLREQEIIDPTTTTKRRRGGRKTISHDSRLFIFGDIIHHNTLPLDGTPGRSIPIAWQYQEGSWMHPFMEAPNRFVGKLFEKVLNYDPYHEIWEKRLAKHLMWWLRTNASYEDKRWPHIGELLKENNLALDERNPQRSKDRFEKAMDRLQTDGLLTWNYVEKNVELPARNWLPTWLQQQIMVEDPPALKQLHATIQEQAKIVREASNSPQRKTRKKKLQP